MDYVSIYNISKKDMKNDTSKKDLTFDQELLNKNKNKAKAQKRYNSQLGNYS